MRKMFGSLVLVVFLATVVLFLNNRLEVAERKFAISQEALSVREAVWWELRSVINTYHQGIMVAIPDYPGGGAPSGPMVLDTHSDRGRYEFAPDGKSAKRIIKFADGKDRVVESWPVPTDLAKQ